MFDDYRVLVLQDEISSRDILHKNVNVFNTTEPSKMIKMLIFVLCVFDHNCKNKFLIKKKISNKEMVNDSDEE